MIKLYLEIDKHGEIHYQFEPFKLIVRGNIYETYKIKSTAHLIDQYTKKSFDTILATLIEEHPYRIIPEVQQELLL